MPKYYRGSFQKSTFFHLLLNHELEQSLALRSTDGNMLMSAHKCQLVLMITPAGHGCIKAGLISISNVDKNILYIGKLVRQRSYWRRRGEYIQRCVCVNIQSSLDENVVFSVCACLCNAAYILFIMFNSISGFNA